MFFSIWLLSLLFVPLFTLVVLLSLAAGGLSLYGQALLVVHPSLSGAACSPSDLVLAHSHYPPASVGPHGEELV